MSQLMACQNANGIVLAADGKAVDFDLSGEMVDLQVDRLVPLGRHAAILTGGAAEGVEMCRTLSDFIAEEELVDVQDIYNAALPFLATEYERYMRKKCEILPVDPINHVYFLLAGASEGDTQQPFRLYLLWTKKKLPQLDGDEIAVAYTAPRIMGLEFKLNKLSQADADLAAIHSEMKQSMAGLAESQDEIGPPFTYAFITREGLQIVD